MKLYLSSYRVPTPHALLNLLGKQFTDVSLAILPHAKDYYSARARQVKMVGVVAYFESLGIKHVEVVDLLEQPSANSLYARLEKYDLIWAVGGNTFTLREAMRQSGFDEIIGPLLAKGIVYGGDSAGALVAGRSIAGAEEADDPAFAGEVIEDGLGLVPFVVVPHVGNPDFYGMSDVFRNIHGESELKEITDAQAIVVDGDSVKISEPAPPSIRDFVTLSGERLVVRILMQFLAELRPKRVSLLWFERLTPDSFMWGFSVDGEKYYLYAEDYIPSLTHIRSVFAERIKGDLELVKAPRAKDFSETSPVQAAKVYKRPMDVEDIMLYAIDSGPDLVFLARNIVK